MGVWAAEAENSVSEGISSSCRLTRQPMPVPYPSVTHACAIPVVSPCLCLTCCLPIHLLMHERTVVNPLPKLGTMASVRLCPNLLELDLSGNELLDVTLVACG